MEMLFCDWLKAIKNSVENPWLCLSCRAGLGRFSLRIFQAGLGLFDPFYLLAGQVFYLYFFVSEVIFQLR